MSTAVAATPAHAKLLDFDDEEEEEEEQEQEQEQHDEQACAAFFKSNQPGSAAPPHSTAPPPQQQQQPAVQPLLLHGGSGGAIAYCRPSTTRTLVTLSSLASSSASVAATSAPVTAHPRPDLETVFAAKRGLTMMRALDRADAILSSAASNLLASMKTAAHILACLHDPMRPIILSSPEWRETRDHLGFLAMPGSLPAMVDGVPHALREDTRVVIRQLFPTTDTHEKLRHRIERTFEWAGVAIDTTSPTWIRFIATMSTHHSFFLGISQADATLNKRATFTMLEVGANGNGAAQCKRVQKSLAACRGLRTMGGPSGLVDLCALLDISLEVVYIFNETPARREAGYAAFHTQCAQQVRKVFEGANDVAVSIIYRCIDVATGKLDRESQQLALYLATEEHWYATSFAINARTTLLSHSNAATAQRVALPPAAKRQRRAAPPPAAAAAAATDATGAHTAKLLQHMRAFAMDIGN